jgi:NADH dehydrogenase FAD-containing subunit
MRFQDCKVMVIAKITIVIENDSTLSLTVFPEVIENFLNVDTTVLSADQIAEKVLLVENLKISFSQDVVTQIDHQ